MTEKREIQYRKKKEKPKYADVAVPGRKFVPGDRSAWYDLLESFKEESDQPSLADIQTGDINIICANCKNRVGYITPRECDVPLRGSMIHRHPGTENWVLPLPNMGPLDFVCPHAVDEGGDWHLFIKVEEGKHEEADTFFTEEHKEFKIVDIVDFHLCLCGCETKIWTEGKEYAGLECWKRHMMELHGEELDEPEQKTEGRTCPCGCGGEVKKNNKYADRLNCYRREQALIGKQAEIENGTRSS